MKEQRIEKITITIDADKLDDTIASDLSTMLRNSPGTTTVYVQIHEPGEKAHIMLKSKSVSVNLKHELTQYIESCEGMNYHIN